jgi:hypothetical protein
MNPWPLYNHAFLVTSLSLTKVSLPLQHESLAVCVFDTATCQEHKFIIEQVLSDHSYSSQFTIFYKFDFSNKVINSIDRAICKM